MNSCVRTSAAFAAASLGDEPLGPSELDPNVRPPWGGSFDVLLVFCVEEAGLGVEATVRPSPLKFLSEGLPQQLPMVDEQVAIGCRADGNGGGVMMCRLQGLDVNATSPRAQPSKLRDLGATALH